MPQLLNKYWYRRTLHHSVGGISSPRNSILFIKICFLRVSGNLRTHAMSFLFIMLKILDLVSGRLSSFSVRLYDIVENNAINQPRLPTKYYEYLQIFVIIWSDDLFNTIYIAVETTITTNVLCKHSFSDIKIRAVREEVICNKLV